MCRRHTTTRGRQAGSTVGSPAGERGLAGLLYPLDRFVVVADEVGDDVGGGTDLVHPSDDLACWHRHELGVLTEAETLVRFRDEEVLERHREWVRRVLLFPYLRPLRLEEPRGLARVDPRANRVG